LRYIHFFLEFIKYYKFTDIDKAFDEYVIEGGMAGSYIYFNHKYKYKYIQDVYNTLIIRNIKKKYNIRNEKVLNNLSNFLLDNISNITSTLNVTKVLNNQNNNINVGRN